MHQSDSSMISSGYGVGTMSGERRLRRQVGKIARWIAGSEHMVAFTGAGISTDSGIPDYRGPEGVWTRRDAGLPPPRWRVPPGEIAPNDSHLSLFELQRLGKLRFLVTQNTDNLHRRSGISPDSPGRVTRQRASHALPRLRPALHQAGGRVG